MYNASWDSRENYDTMMEIIMVYGLSAVDVLDYLTDYHGLSLLSEAFMENLIENEL